MTHASAKRHWAALVGASWLAIVAVPARADDLDKAVDFKIPAESLESALLELSKQASYQIVFSATTLPNRPAPAIAGRMSIRKALDLLLAGTELGYKLVGAHTLTVAPGASAAASRPMSYNNATSTQSGAQVDQGPSNPPEKSQQPSEKKPVWVEEIVVVGSRIPTAVSDSAVPVFVYTRPQIESSGASTVAEFLNTLPQVSVQTTTTGGSQQFAGATTVQLHGLPAGTTLVLLNGRRVESSTGSQGASGFFDLSQIPLAAVERTEVLPTGSSAIYGGDALGGIVNIVLKKDFQGFEADARYGRTSDGAYGDSQFSLAAGWKSSGWSLSLVGLYAKNSELSGDERSITASQDYRRFGGIDARIPFGNPGNVCSTDGTNLPGLASSCAAIPKGSTGIGLTPADFSATAGVLNMASLNSYSSLLAPSRHYGGYGSATYELTSSTQIFAELLYSHLEASAFEFPPLSPILVPASNQNNPFGTDVLVNYIFTGIGRQCYSCTTTDYVRPLVGIRGTLLAKWNWELAGWTSRDRENIPQTFHVFNSGPFDTALASGAFNPFQDGPGASPSVLNSFYGTFFQKFRGELDAANGFIHGPLATLPAGSLEGLIGGEYQRDRLVWDIPEVATQTFNIHRHSEAGFAELKVPIVGRRSQTDGADLLSAQFAVRYDHYSDFGGRTSPQAGLEFRPFKPVLLRASYSSAFKPATLVALYSPVTVFPQALPVIDPLRGGQSEIADLVFGGNPALRPETGSSKTLGAVFSPEQIVGLDLTLSHWAIRLKNGVIFPASQYLVNNPQVFPGRVVRAPPSPGDPFPVGPIVSVDASYANFGSIDEAGFDFTVNWRTQTSIGEFSPAIAVTETYRYMFEIDPVAGPQNAVSQANDQAIYAPRWKGTAALNWKYNLLQVGIDGRYTGKYRDVTDLTSNPRQLGNFWYVDFNVRYELGRTLAPDSRFRSKINLSAGARNLFNKLPAYSDFGFGQGGYDPNQYDILGRSVWAQLSVQF
jgi:iron complex outermembrane recepter protein